MWMNLSIDLSIYHKEEDEVREKNQWLMIIMIYIYIYIVENEEWFEISRWTNGTWILYNVYNVMWRILKKRTLIHWSNGQFFLS